jgi:hypothetical protein
MHVPADEDRLDRPGSDDLQPLSVLGIPGTRHPWEAQFSGETHDAGSDIVGGSSGGIATIFSGLRVQDKVTDAFGTIPCTLTADVDSSRYGLNGSGGRGCGSWSIFTNGI